MLKRLVSREFRMGWINMTIGENPIERTRLDNIQALRGIAALAILFYHLALFIRGGVFKGQSGFPFGAWD